MTVLIHLVFAWFIGWASAAMLLELYEGARPKTKIDDREIESHEKEIGRAKNKYSFLFGLFTALAWFIWSDI